MICLSITSVTEVYGDASGCEIARHWVDHAGLADVSRSLRSMVQSLGADAEDEFWRLTLGPLRRITFALCSAPVPFATIAEILKPDCEKLIRQGHLCRQLFPDAHGRLEAVLRSLEPILAETYSPFLPALESIAGQSPEMSVIMRNPRWNRAAADTFAANTALRGVKVSSAAQLRGAHHCNTLAVIGPCAWFPEYVFSAPRAFSIHIISYRWIRDSWKPGPIFLPGTGESSSHSGNHRIGSLPRVGGVTVPEHAQPGDIQPADLLPPLPAFVHGGSHSVGSGAANREETLPARLCQLSGGRAVYVSAEDGASSLVIDTSELGDSIVRRVPVGELEPGVYLLLRTAGGGDFIAPLADRILGLLATARRSQQAEWKVKLLERACEQFGVLTRRELSHRIARHLQAASPNQVRAANIHYWMGSKCIRPRDRKDFSAILRFAGMEGREKELWEAMGDIDSAHRQAGHHIRQMLLQKIATALPDADLAGAIFADFGGRGLRRGWFRTGCLACCGLRRVGADRGAGGGRD